MSDSFDTWMQKVDDIFIREVGLESSHFPDWHWRDAFDEDQTPKEAFNDYRSDYAEDFPF